MASKNYILAVAWFAEFRISTETPVVPDGGKLQLVVAENSLLDGMKPGTPLDLRLAGEPMGHGLTCIFLWYEPDYSGRPVGYTWRMPLAWPLTEPVPVVRPFLSLSLPSLPTPEPSYGRRFAAIETDGFSRWRILGHE